eukprot:3107967-Rhodomonas_salina.1
MACPGLDLLPRRCGSHHHVDLVSLQVNGRFEQIPQPRSDISALAPGLVYMLLQGSPLDKFQKGGVTLKHGFGIIQALIFQGQDQVVHHVVVDLSVGPC